MKNRNLNDTELEKVVGGLPDGIIIKMGDWDEDDIRAEYIDEPGAENVLIPPIVPKTVV